MEKYSGNAMKTFLRCCEEEINIPLQGQITGNIPLWIKGTLLRNGPGTTKIGISQYKHVFDGSAFLHRKIPEMFIVGELPDYLNDLDEFGFLSVIWFNLSDRIIFSNFVSKRFSINSGTVTYQCRFLNTATLRKNRRANRIVVSEFGTKSVPDPCHTIFDRIKTVFNLEDLISDNAGVSIRPFGDKIYAMTEVATVYRIDPKTLITLEKKSLINSLIVCHTAHPHTMPNGDVYNIGLKVINGLFKHVVVRFPYSKGNMFDLAEIVSVINPRWRFNPSYMHSFGITDNYFIIIEQPLGISALKIKSLVQQTQIVLVNRNTNVQTRYYTDTFFYMHLVNAFEKNGKLYIDLCTYQDANIIDAMYIEAIKNMESNPDYAQWCQSRPKRIEIPLDAPSHTKVESRLLANASIEIPAINYNYNGRSYRFMYGIGSDASTASGYSNSIIKIDARTGEIKKWHEYDAYPSEPVFVAHPDCKSEDDGVLLCVLLWGTDDHAVTLLVLNAQDLQEIGRVNFTTPSQAPKCIHGWFLPN